MVRLVRNILPHKFHRICIFQVCDADLNILSVSARFPGSTHDAAIWQTSSIRRHLEETYFRGNRNAFLLGDSGYPLEPWLMTPILDVDENTPEGRYTTAHCRARNSIERCIGLLKSRFRCLLKHRTLQYDPIIAGKIINTCVVLHNICIRNNVLLEEPIENEEEDNFIACNENYNMQPNLLHAAENNRRNLVQHFN